MNENNGYFFQRFHGGEGTNHISGVPVQKWHLQYPNGAMSCLATSMRWEYYDIGNVFAVINLLRRMSRRFSRARCC